MQGICEGTSEGMPAQKEHLPVRKIHRLSALAVERMNRPGKLHDGGGLYLIASPRTGKDAEGVARRWQLRLSIPTSPGIKRRWRWAGLGSFPDVSLAAAREQASRMRAQQREGFDPILARRKARAEALKAARDARTLDQAFAACLEDQAAGWKNGASRAQWEAEWKTYGSPKIGGMLLNSVAVADILKVMRPLWTEHPVLADRFLNRIERAIDYAIPHGWRTVASNPAEQARKMLPKRSTVHAVEHYAALPADDMPDLLRKVRVIESVAARAIELLALTAVRSNELLGAQWEEINLSAATWVIPAKRMKGAKNATSDHFVPLSRQASELLAALRPADATGPVFFGLTRSKVGKVFGRLKVESTLHGLRSTFSSWSNENRIAASDVIEAVLAHKSGNAVKDAYDRGDRREQRRILMQQWADFCDGRAAANNVTPLRA